MKSSLAPLPISNNIQQWYAVYCKPRQEAIAQQNLEHQGFAVYLPRVQVRHRRLKHWVTKIEALFPRYLFVRVDRERQGTGVIRSTRGALGLVRLGGEPAAVPDDVIKAIRAREDAATGLHCGVQPSLRPGEPVTLIDGPFTGLESIFVSEDGDHRAVLLIELLGKTNQLRVSRDWLACPV